MWSFLLGRLPWLLLATVLLASNAVAVPSIRTCPQPFTGNLTAFAYTQAVAPSWDLDKAMDADVDGNLSVLSTKLDGEKAAGFNSVRIAVDFANHYTTASPSWEVDDKWLQRLSDIVDAVTSKGLYAIVSMHHGTDTSAILGQFQQSWRHIGFLLTCSSDLVVFETLSEPPATTTEHDGLLTDLNNQFVVALAATGGYNSLRFVILLGPRTDGKWVVPPRYIVNPWAVQYRHS
ncbi:putative extracellular protein [Echria macrotheca]|uniref:Extracellular protein n=1 Tax=Echria macrotheca TaxID=438768 RepID=A0AAJ0FD04_9PEZI|nr:putative extracellular protein [Echria macrotheca]